MSFSSALSSVLRQYATFSGRARRSEYWWFQLAIALAYLGVGVVGAVLASVSGAVGGEAVQSVAGTVFSLVLMAGYVVVLLPSLAVTVRRVHDTGRSGWWVLVGALPLLSVVLFVFTLLDSAPGANRHGPSPKAPRTWSPQPGWAV
ncbi:DUF805 domain-containing protein [Kineococcus auxinigenes]|uniref:DUF805 domain-containing protein n=1 Tax=unclassified Kineococcus TaxID=2621656 RepID=UPI003D7E637C